MTDTVPQDTSLPDDVVERAARAAVADIEGDFDRRLFEDVPRYGDVAKLDAFYIDGNLDMLRLVRVISAALKEAHHG